jgi:hypothetical protein
VRLPDDGDVGKVFVAVLLVDGGLALGLVKRYFFAIGGRVGWSDGILEEEWYGTKGKTGMAFARHEYHIGEGDDDGLFVKDGKASGIAKLSN